MAMFGDCMGCQDGEHTEHQEVVKAPPAGGVGGDVCRCSGDCAERNLIWWVAFGNRAQMYADGDRAKERLKLGHRVEGPMSAAQARSAVLAHSLVRTIADRASHPTPEEGR